MADKTASQTQQKIVEEQLDRMQAIQAEIAKLEGKGVEEARRAIDEGARLLKESLAYGVQLSTAWRTFTLEAGRRSLDLMSVRG